MEASRRWCYGFAGEDVGMATDWETAQPNCLAWIAVALLGGALLGASLMANAQGAEGPIIILSGEKSDWLGFWGAILGAAATIGAGAAAWLAMQHQLYAPIKRAMETISAFSITTQHATMDIHQSIKDIISANTVQSGSTTKSDTESVHRSMRTLIGKFDNQMHFETDLANAYVVSPPIIVLKARTVQLSVTALREQLSNEKRWTDLGEVRRSAIRVLGDIDSLNRALNDYGRRR